jgi:hypothetical protein
MKTCSKCGLTLRGSDQEGDICLTCLSSLTPHCNFDQGYSTIEGAIRQSTDNPMRTEITTKDFKYINRPRNMIEETMHYIMTEHFKGILDPNHKYFDLYISLQKLLEEYNNGK